MEMTEDAAERVPITASHHPATWRFDYPIFHAESREAWRAWLQVNTHGFAPGEPESVMIGTARALAVDVRIPDEIVLRRISDEPDTCAVAADAAGGVR